MTLCFPQEKVHAKCHKSSFYLIQWVRNKVECEIYEGLLLKFWWRRRVDPIFLGGKRRFFCIPYKNFQQERREVFYC